jgi:uncharacterized membrane protein
VSTSDVAKNQVRRLAAKVVDVLPRRAAEQTVTIAASRERIEQFWRDPGEMSVVLGDIAQVDSVGSDRFRWRLLTASDVTWESRLVSEPDGLRFVGTDGNELAVRLRSAPQDLGTEVTLRLKTPAPGMLSGAAAFKALYRLRALLQTGEVPTLRSNPSARASAR